MSYTQPRLGIRVSFRFRSPLDQGWTRSADGSVRSCTSFVLVVPARTLLHVCYLQLPEGYGANRTPIRLEYFLFDCEAGFPSLPASADLAQVDLESDVPEFKPGHDASSVIESGSNAESNTEEMIGADAPAVGFPLGGAGPFLCTQGAYPFFFPTPEFRALSSRPSPQLKRRRRQPVDLAPFGFLFGFVFCAWSSPLFDPLRNLCGCMGGSPAAAGEYNERAQRRLRWHPIQLPVGASLRAPVPPGRVWWVAHPLLRGNPPRGGLPLPSGHPRPGRCAPPVSHSDICIVPLLRWWTLSVLALCLCGYSRTVLFALACAGGDGVVVEVRQEHNVSGISVKNLFEVCEDPSRRPLPRAPQIELSFPDHPP